eukprot:4863863-Amphidinium_carterae.1
MILVATVCSEVCGLYRECCFPPACLVSAAVAAAGAVNKRAFAPYGCAVGIAVERTNCFRPSKNNKHQFASVAPLFLVIISKNAW